MKVKNFFKHKRHTNAQKNSLNIHYFHRICSRVLYISNFEVEFLKIYQTESESAQFSW